MTEPRVHEIELGGPGDLLLLYEGPPPSEDLVASMVEKLTGGPHLDAVGRGQPVTDAVKVIDAEGRVTDTLDRANLVTLGLPAVVRRTAWEAREIRTIGLI